MRSARERIAVYSHPLSALVRLAPVQRLFPKRRARAFSVLSLVPAALIRVATSPSIGGAQNPGFFTTISSNGNANPIIWAISHPPNTKAAPIYLFAFDPESGTTMKELFKGTAGAWPNLGGNSNLVPVVANGLVFVASNKQLQIFGLIGTKSKK